MADPKDPKDPITKDQDPSVPGNIVESHTRRGEDIARQEQEAGRVDLGPQGESKRPAGKSTARLLTGVDPQDSITQDKPAG
jgi:hypothetical protein